MGYYSENLVPKVHTKNPQFLGKRQPFLWGDSSSLCGLVWTPWERFQDPFPQVVTQTVGDFIVKPGKESS